MPEINQSVKAARQAGGYWVERLATDDSDKCREEFKGWIAQSPLHIEAYLFAKTVAELFKVSDPDRRIAFADLHSDSGVISIGEANPAAVNADERLARRDLTHQWSPSGYRSGTGSRSALRFFSISAAAAAICGAVWLCSQYFGNPTYLAGLGEQRTIRLVDGSIVDLNTQTSIEVDFSKHARVIKLLHGEAAFRVVHQAKRPFRVVSEDAVVQALGTEFSVYRHDGSTRVAVIEGRVAVAPTGENAPTTAQVPEPPAAVADLPAAQLLSTGEEADVSRSGRLVKSSHPNVAEAVSWRQRRLSFDDQPLSTVVAEFHRYSDFTITLEGETPKDRRIRGVFHSDRPESLVEFLELDKGLQVEHVANGVIVRAR